jgi:uncharacterized integral membrane protein
MGNSFHYQRVRLHAAKIHKFHIPYTRIMLHFFSDIVDKQLHILEAKGAWVILPIFGVNCYLMAWFVDIHIWSDSFDLIKNIALSLIGIAMGIMGCVNTFLAMKQRIKKYKEENKTNKKKAA